MTCCEEEQRGTRPHAVDLSSASESGTYRGTYAGTGTQAGELTALRALSSLLELMSSQIPMTCQDRGFRRSREGSHSIEGNADTCLAFLLTSKVF